MSISFYQGLAQAPSAAPVVSSGGGSYSVATQRRTASGSTSISPVVPNQGFPMTVTPQAYGDADALVADRILVSSDGGTTWTLQSNSGTGEITLNSFDAGAPTVSSGDTQTSGVTAIDFGTFGPADSPSTLVYILNDPGSDALSFLEYNVLDPVSLELATEFAGSVTFEIEGTLANSAGDGTLNVTQNISDIWKRPEEGVTVTPLNLPQANFVKLRVSLVNYPVSGFSESNVTLSVDITTSNSLRVIPNYIKWETGAFRYDEERGYDFPFITASGSTLTVGPALVNIGGFAAVNPVNKDFDGLADGTYRVYVSATGVYDVQLTSSGLPLGAQEIATFTVSSGDPGDIVFTSSVQSNYGTLPSDEAINRGRFVQVGNTGRLEYADGTKTSVGVSTSSVAALEDLNYSYGDYALVEVDAAYDAGTEIGEGTDGIGTSGGSLGVMLTASTAANEFTLVKLLSSGGGDGGGGGPSGDDELVAASGNDTTPGTLSDKLVAGLGILITENNDGGNETLTLSVPSTNVPQPAEVYYEFSDATDSSGKGLDLTENGSPTYGAGKVGDAANLNGSSWFSRVTSPEVEFGDKDWTIMCWARTTTETSVHLVSKVAATVADWEFVMFTSANRTVRCLVGNGGTTNYGGPTSSDNAYTLNEWFHAAVTYDEADNRITLYVNGVTEGVFFPGGTLGTSIQNFTIGARPNGTATLPGDIDQVIKLDFVATASQISAIYNGGLGTSTPLVVFGSTSVPAYSLVSENDLFPGFLDGKLIGGQGISLTRGNLGADETLTLDKTAVTPSALGISSGTLAIDASENEYFTVELTENITTITLSNLVPGSRLKIEFYQDATGGRTVSGWPSVLWPSGTAPVFAGAANSEETTVDLFSRDGTVVKGTFDGVFS